jgi:hypothetical protein
MEPSLNSEQARTARVVATGLCDRDTRLAFHSSVAMAKLICDCALASVSLIDDEKVHFLSHNFGVPLDVSELRRDHSLCAQVLASPLPRIVPDLRLDPDLRHHVFVEGAPHFVFWAGFPLTDDDGFILGSLSVADFHPIHLDQRSVDLMIGLARQVSRQIKTLRHDQSDLWPSIVALLQGLARSAPTLCLPDAEAFLQLCNGNPPDPCAAKRLIEAGLAKPGGAGGVVLSALGEQIRADQNLNAPALRQKRARMLQPDQIRYYFDQLSSSGNAA